MKERNTSPEITGYKKRSTSNKQETRKAQIKITENKSVKGKSNYKAAKSEVMEFYPPEILKMCKNLKTICVKIEKLEKEKQKLLRIILRDVPKSVSS